MIDYKKLYQLFDWDMSCANCEGSCCEKAGAVVLFPGEASFLVSVSPEIQKQIAVKSIEGETIELLKQPCHFHKGGGCILGDMRPLDCRIYPFDWCMNRGKKEIFFSRDCNAAKIDQVKIKELKATINNLLTNFSNKWLKAASLFGPCGLCGQRGAKNCELWPPKGYNMQEW